MTWLGSVCAFASATDPTSASAAALAKSRDLTGRMKVSLNG
jgi:hypothetical protein